MASRLRVAVVGYGSGGQAAAVLLSRDGHRVEVFEQAAAPGPVGAGFLLQPTGLSVLWALGLLDAALGHGAPVRRLYGENVAGRAVMDMRYADLHRRYFGLGLQRGALFALLDAAWEQERCLHTDCRVEHIDAERGLLRDRHGREHGGFDLVLVADGAASQLRAQVAAPALDRPYPWGAQWCLVEAGDWPWRDELRQRYQGARRMSGMLPVGSRPGDPVRRLSFFWSVPGAALAAAQTQDEGAWRAQVAAVWPEAERWLRTVRAPSALAQARYRDAVLPQWSRGRAALLGDAAHAMSPQLGQGVNMALADALALREALRARESDSAAAIAAALARYQRERRAHVAVYHFWSRWLTPLFQSEHDRLAGVRDRVFHPLSRLPLGRGRMLRVLTGLQRGWLGSWPLPPAFVAALDERAAALEASEG